MLHAVGSTAANALLLVAVAGELISHVDAVATTAVARILLPILSRLQLDGAPEIHDVHLGSRAAG